MHIIIYTAKREKPFVLGQIGLSLTVLFSLLALSAWTGVWCGRQSGRLSAELTGLHEAIALGRMNLEAAAGAADSARSRLARTAPPGLEAFLHSIDSLRGGTPPETVSVVTTVSSGSIAIQISSHPLEQDARREAAALAIRTGTRPSVEEVLVGPRTWFRVLIEGFREEKAARALADSLLKSGVIREYVIQELKRPFRQIP